MQKAQKKQKSEDAKKAALLVARLNQYRDEYYNKANPTVSDVVYDRLYDELQELEKKTGITHSNSPTQTEELLRQDRIPLQGRHSLQV